MNEIIFSEQRRYIVEEDAFYEGQCSRLYKAMDVKFKRYVIIKVVDSESSLEIFEREVTICCSLSNHTSQVPFVLDYKKENKKLYIVMQWIAGKDLSDVLHTGCNDYVKLKYARDLCSIVSIMHKNRYEHRDLKPDNIRVGNDDRIYLLDFNLSSIQRHRGEGTANYRAPENDMNYSMNGNGAMDVFSLGVILYQMFTNHLPEPFVDYVGDYYDKEWHIFKEPKEYNPKINSVLNDLIVKCMKLNPKDRYQNASQILYQMKKVKV